MNSIGRDVRRYIRLAREMGIQNFEWVHFFTQWGCEHPNSNL